MLNGWKEFDAELMLDVVSKQEDKIASVERVQVEPGVAKHQNFLSFVFKVTVHISLINGQPATRTVFVKYGENGKKNAGFEIKKRYFDAEAKAYGLLYNFCSWAEKNNYKINKYWADCLYTSIDNNIFIIMLQDLTEIGFSVMRQARGLLDKDHIYVAVDRLARCHAMTRLYITQQAPDTKDWPEPRFDFLKPFVKSGLKVLAEAVLKYNKKWDYIHTYLLELSESFNDEYLECIQRVQNDFPVLSMGDCWTNNILFKYSDTGCRKPLDVRFIDFQFSSITSFAWDLQNLIYITSLPKARMDNLEALLITYHDAFEETIAHMGGQPQLSPTLKQINTIMDKLLLPQFIYSAISAVEIYSSDVDDFENGGLPEIPINWFLDNAEENGYIDNIKYFESKGLFGKKRKEKDK